MRILITAGSLDAVGGVQVYVRDLAAWLLARGHSPVVYGPQLGDAAAQLRRLTIPVTDDLDTIAVAPEVIHGNSSAETMTALLHFPSVPALFTCHAWRGRSGSAPRFPRLLRYVAVDDTCADRLRLEEGVSPETLTVLLNGVDTKRYQARVAPLPPRPRRALVFGNAAHETTHLPVIREACQRSGIEVDVISSSSGTFTDHPEAFLGRYDLVFAKAKCALEAMACGAAVILCDVAGMGGLVRAVDLDRLRRLNFGARTLSAPVNVDALAREIAAYDPADAAVVSERIRRTAASDDLHARILELCEEVVALQAQAPIDRDQEARAAARFLRELTRAEGEQYARLNVVVQATHRVLRTPVIGPALSRIARRLVAGGRKRVW
ncbi:MAG: glycosyltransferase [Acidobacteriota bacterium]